MSSLQYFKKYDSFLESQSEPNDLDGKFLRRDPDKLISKATDLMRSSNYSESLRLFAKAFKNTKDEDKKEAVEKILGNVEKYKIEEFFRTPEELEKFETFEDDLDNELIDGDRKLNAAIRKVEHAKDKLDNAQEEITKGNYVQAAEYVKDAERKLDKAYNKKIEDSKASDEDKDKVKADIAEVIKHVKSLQDNIKSHLVEINNEADKERIEKKLDKRELDAIIALEDGAADTAATTNSVTVDDPGNAAAGTADIVSDNTQQTSGNIVSNEAEDVLDKENILQVALDPELYKNPKLTKTLQVAEARRIASILWNSMSGVGTDEEMLFSAFKSPNLKTIADFSFLSSVYKKISGEKGDEPVQDLYEAIYDQLLGQVELTTSERNKLADLILDRVKGSFKK